ncbi:MAG: phosphatase PAP2 family protein [Armatimonadota bacterium]|nr:MAG: phosphatase PAP2 family protein [Armatimonadota bacterium]
MVWRFRQIDEAVLLFLNHVGADGMLRDIVIRLLATGLLYALLAVVIYVSLKKDRSPQMLIVAVAGALVAGMVGKLLNQMVPRDRPFVALPDDVRHVALIVRPDSFPSIHAATAFGLAGVVLLGYSGRWGAVMLGLALVMGAARVAAGVHWPSDIGGGMPIGVVVAALVVAAQRRYWPHPRRATATPAAKSGGCH